MLYCSNCGTGIEENDKCCAKCGAPVKKPAVPVCPGSKAQAEPWLKFMLLGLAALLVTLAVVQGANFFSQPKTSDPLISVPEDYGSLQEAIDAVENGDTIMMPYEDPKPTTNTPTDTPQITWVARPVQLINHRSLIYQYFEVTGGSGEIEITARDRTDTFHVEEGKAYKLSISLAINLIPTQSTLDEYIITISSPSSETVAKNILESPYRGSGKQAIAVSVGRMDLELWEYTPPVLPLEVWDIPHCSTIRVYFDSNRRPIEKYEVNRYGQETRLLKSWLYNDTNENLVIPFESIEEGLEITAGPGGLLKSDIYYNEYKETTYYTYNSPVFTQREPL